MGASCSKLDKDSDPDQRHEKEFDGPAARLQKKIVSHHRGGKMNDPGPREQLVIGHYDEKVTTKLDGLDPQKPLIYEEQTSKPDLAPDSPTETQQPESQYFQDRVEIERRGRQLAFDHALTVKATTSEQKAKVLLEIIRQNDEVVFYSLADPLQGYRGQKHRRFAGDHFLTNSEILVQTALFRVAQEMPKGAHLHLHFNSTLLPNELLDIAENMEQMYISSDKALTSAENCDTCEIQFLMKSEVVTADDRTTLQAKLSKEGLASSDAELCNLFHRDYTQRVNDSNQRLSWMKYRVFREQWARISETRTADKGRATRKNSAVKKSLAVDDLQSLVDFENTSKDWLISKLVFDDQEAHNSHQTSEG